MCLTLDFYPCPRGCSGFGSCDTGTGVCNCQAGYFDLDCTITPTLLRGGTRTNVTLKVTSWTYVYFQMKSKIVWLFFISKGGGSTNLGVISPSPGISVAINVNDPTSTKLPNFQYYYSLYNFQDAENYIYINSDLNSKYDGYWLVMGIYNPLSYEFTITVIPQNEAAPVSVTTIILYIMIGVFACLMVLVIYFSITRYRYNRRQERMLRERLEN